MSKRKPAGDKGTADRIEADDGGYWVRLVTKQALIREGECLVNCLRHGSLSRVAGDEETFSNGLWSLRKACGTSYALVEVCGYKTAWQVVQLQGPHNHNPSPWSVRQVRHLRALFTAAGLDLWVDPKKVLVGPDGMTHRPDKAPADVRAAAEAERIEHERWAAERREAQPSLGSMPAPQIILYEADDYSDAVIARWRTGLGVDTQPPAMDVSSWAEANLLRSEAERGTYEPFVSSTLRYLSACVGEPYESFVRDWNASAEAEMERIRRRGVMISTPPTDDRFVMLGTRRIGDTVLRNHPPNPGARA